jgi:hypothetical protein
VVGWIHLGVLIADLIHAVFRTSRAIMITTGTVVATGTAITIIRIILIILILPAIGGVKVGVKPVITPNTLPPVVGVFRDDFIAASASLCVIVVGRDAHHIGRIDL